MWVERWQVESGDKCWDEVESVEKWYVRIERVVLDRDWSKFSGLREVELG